MGGTAVIPPEAVTNQPLEIGTQAPAFELNSTSNEKVALSDFRGRPVILAFYPADWSPVCFDQMALYQAQGAFWPMHGMLFENQGGLAPSNLHAYAETLGLDVVRFDTELSEGVHTPRVREDFMSGVRSDVNGTPTLFINGLRYAESWDPPHLLAALQSAAGLVTS